MNSSTSNEPETPAFPGFVRGLFADGEVVVAPFTGEALEPDARCAAWLGELDERQRRQSGPELPALRADVAWWAARTLYRACQFLVCRAVPAEMVTRELAIACPGPRDATAAYSADLFLGYLPDVFEIARQLAPEDPLVIALRRLSREWPLSSVGISDTAASADAVIAHPGLRRIYVDRIAARRATDRLADDRVRAQLRADAGLFPDLLPFPANAYAP